LEFIAPECEDDACELQPSITVDNYYLGSEDGSSIFTIPMSVDFPKYGGQIFITLPTWYCESEAVCPDGNDPEYVLSTNTECESPDLEIVASGGQEEFLVVFSLYRGDGTGDLTLTCTGYKNPVYPKDVSGFSITVKDNERVANEILSYISFTLESAELMVPIEASDIVPTFLQLDP
jgi:hypothetical protein